MHTVDIDLKFLALPMEALSLCYEDLINHIAVSSHDFARLPESGRWFTHASVEL